MPFKLSRIMYFKHFFAQALIIPLLTYLCAGRVFSEDQVPLLSTSQNNPHVIQKALKQAHIIPDVLNNFIPSCYLHIVYASSHHVVRLGDKLKPAHAKKAPVVRISCPNATNVKGFTVALTDPDAPSRVDLEWSEMCHWIVTVPTTAGGSLEDGDVLWDEAYEEPGEIVEYKPPGPPPKTGYHRYVFVLIAGDNRNLTAPSERKHWGTGKARHGVRDWAEREGLEVIGANFFYARDKKQ